MSETVDEAQAVRAERDALLERLDALTRERDEALEDGQVRIEALRASIRVLADGRDADRAEVAALREVLERARAALVQANGALRLDAMVDDNGKPFGTTSVALEDTDAALSAIDALAGKPTPPPEPAPSPHAAPLSPEGPSVSEVAGLPVDPEADARFDRWVAARDRLASAPESRPCANRHSSDEGVAMCSLRDGHKGDHHMLDNDGSPIESWAQLPRCLACNYELSCTHARVSSPEEPSEPEPWACRTCGHVGEGFITVQHRAGDYDVECPECGSDETSESAAEALSILTSKVDRLAHEAHEAREAALEEARRIADVERERIKHTSHADGLGMGWLAGEDVCKRIRDDIAALKAKAQPSETSGEGGGR